MSTLLRAGLDLAAMVFMDIANLAMDIRQLRKDALEGRVSIEQLLDIIEKLQHTIHRLETQVELRTERLAQYEPEIRREATNSASAADKPGLSYSMDAEHKRRRRRRRKKSPGRRPTEVKFADAKRIDDIYPDGVRRCDCQVVRERAVWRLEDGRAVLVGYRIFAGGGAAEPRIPGVTPRCEYGIEILVVLAFLVYIIGISLDKACAVLGFFCLLPLSRSQADALLRQLAHHWEKEFDLLCALLAYAAVVYLDETGWKVGKEGCSLWAFAAKWQRVFLFGCHKNDATLDTILPPDVFDGIGVSDDAAVYRDRFTQAQKCWAHLLRKAIRLALWYPRKKKYQRFLDQLLALYHQAKRVAADGRLGEAGRQQRVAELEDRLGELCRPYWREATSDMTPHERDFTNLVNELVRLMLAEELFTFVLHLEVESTNNFMERQLRNPAQDRKTGRTSKTAAGAHRRSVIVSVLESLRANLEKFNLTTVLEEVGRWMKEGISLFARQWQTIIENEPAAVPNTS
jgi:transposase